MTVSGRIRQELRDGGKSINAIAKESGVNRSMVSRFMSGCDLQGKTLDRLACYLQLELQPCRNHDNS